MKKLLGLLSVLTISVTAVPTTIAASPYQKEETLNRNKRETIKANRKIKFEGCCTSYKGELKLNSSEKKIRFSGNNQKFHQYWSISSYYIITVKDQNGNTIKKIDMHSNNSMQDIINNNNLQNGISYQNGYIIEVFAKEPWRIWFNIGNENTWKRFAFVDSGDWDWDWKYRINNDYLVEYYEYNEKIKLLGIGYGYKGEIGLDTTNKKIRFFGNNNWFHEYFVNKNYKKIIIKNQNNQIIKEIIIYGNESMEKIIKDYNLKNGIDYNYGYFIEIWSAETNRTKINFNDKNVLESQNWLSNQKFILINDKLLTFDFYQKEHFNLILEWKENYDLWKNELNRQIKQDVPSFTIEQKRTWKGDKYNQLKDKIHSLKQDLKII